MTLTSCAARNPDGGWPYYAGKTSRLEPTAWALLALRRRASAVSLDPLLAWPRRDGWFLDRSSDEVNVGFNALVGGGSGALDAPSPDRSDWRRALVDARGQTAPAVRPATCRTTASRAGRGLSGTFSWVEPTALGLLALKRLGAR